MENSAAEDRAAVRRGSAVGIALTLSAACILLMGCSGPSTDGPLQFSASEDTVCAPTPKFKDAALGVLLPGDLTSNITIDSIVLVDAKNAVLGKTSLMPVTTGSRLLLDQYPPTKQFPTNWPNAEPAIGTVIEPRTAHDLVLEVRSNGTDPGRLSGVVITYTSGGRQYVARTHLSLKLKKAASC
ncbi:MAG: hypothetical protein JWQ12_2079 [Glaciihabitans sp.]|nr:hypothetical protein [Glaciihabitans sp.]